MTRAAPIDVLDYLDYRAFLRDVYVDRKKTRGFSFRAFSKRAGLRSPNYFKLVMDGVRNLTDGMAVRFAAALGLKDEAAEYFTELVRFNQATTMAQRNLCYSRLTGFRGYRKAQPLELAHAAYHSQWYLPAIRELVTHHAFKEDPKWIASIMMPPIKEKEAAEGLAVLLELGLLKPGAKGKLEQSDARVSTGPETRGLHITNYHRMMMHKAAESIDLVRSGDRDISSLTLCLGGDGLRRLKDRVVRFRKELVELSILEDAPEQVIQLNFQLFPLTRMEEPR